jgi:hypothetical protein
MEPEQSLKLQAWGSLMVQTFFFNKLMKIVQYWYSILTGGARGREYYYSAWMESVKSPVSKICLLPKVG